MLVCGRTCLSSERIAGREEVVEEEVVEEEAGARPATPRGRAEVTR